MPDPAEERAAYKERLARAEAEALADADPHSQEWYAQIGTPLETPAFPEGADATPVVASDQLEIDEPEAPVAESPQEETPAEDVTPEELKGQIEALKAQLAEKETFIGRQGSEVGALRASIDELSRQLAEQPVRAPIQQGPQILVTQDLIDSDPAQATLIAYRQNDERALSLAFEAWKDVDPFAAASWRSDAILERERSAWQEEFASLRSEISTVSAPVQQQQEQRVWQDAFSLVSQEHPEFVSNATRILEDVAPRYPHLVGSLATGDAAAKAEILKALYVLDRAQNPEAVRAELAEAAAAAAAEEAATRAAAAPVVGQTTAGQPGREPTYEEQEKEAYRQRLGGRVSLDRGWTRRQAA